MCQRIFSGFFSYFFLYFLYVFASRKTRFLIKFPEYVNVDGIHSLFMFITLINYAATHSLSSSFHFKLSCLLSAELVPNLVLSKLFLRAAKALSIVSFFPPC